MKKSLFLFVGLLIFSALWWAPAVVTAAPFPSLIPLPDGFQPEGIVTGRGHTLYAGSLVNGAIYQVNLRTGEGSILVPGQAGRVAVGLGFDQRTNYIFVAGGPTGNAYVHDAGSGATVAVYELTDEPNTFINDVIVTREAAYFTNSFQPVYYRLPLGAGGRLPDTTAVEEIPLSGDFAFVPGQFNANGIEATPNGKSLIIVNSTLGALYRVEPTTGVATQIDLGGDAVPAGDGLLLHGWTLYVVQNFLNQVAVVRLSPNLASGEVTQLLTDPNFDIPTTVASFGASLYVVNARFSTPPTPDTTYNIVKLPRVPGS